MGNSFPESEILIMITLGVVIMLLFAIVFILFFYFSQKKFQLQKIEAQRKEIQLQEQLLFSSIQAQENERERIARELHDEVGSKLNIINLGIHRLIKSKEEKKEDRTSAELFDIIGNTIDATRNIAHDLLPPTLKRFGIQIALEELCESYQKNANTEVRFEICQQELPLDDNTIALNIFRVVQELISNTFKYAAADRIELKLWLEKHQIRLSYQDDGKGFNMEDPNHHTGLGLQNIETRARMIGAEYQLKTSIGKGMFFQLKKEYL